MTAGRGNDNRQDGGAAVSAVLLTTHERSTAADGYGTQPFG
jgi:hypothetical protein